MKFLERTIAIFLCAALISYGQGNSFKKVRYNGGSIDSKVNPKDWDNRLTVTSDLITLELKPGSKKYYKKLEIPPKSVTSLSYGQEAHRRVGTMVGLALLSAVALFGLFAKTRLHYIGIEYTTPDGKSAGILLQGDKNNYRAILVALQGVTGVPVAVGEKDRDFIPVGVKIAVAKGDEENQQTQGKPSQAGPAPAATDATKGTISISSNPPGSDVLVDGEFVGSSPAVLKLAPGKHTVTVKSPGFKDWSKEIDVQPGSEAQLTANLEK